MSDNEFEVADYVDSTEEWSPIPAWTLIVTISLMLIGTYLVIANTAL